MEEPMATQDQVQAALLDKILEHSEKAATSEVLLKLAEAFAWVTAPNQPHGVAGHTLRQ
jgi:hypothetical protein